MSASIIRSNGADAYDLIYPEHLAKLSTGDQEIMRRTMINSMHIWIGRDDTTVLAIWGLVPPTLLSDQAYLWMYHTEHLHEHSFMFIRHSQRAIAEALESFSSIIGHCTIGNDSARRWLKWLGAEFGPPSGPLIPFEIKAKPQWPIQSHSA